MVKEISKIAWITLNKKLVLMVGDDYKGDIDIQCPYDILIGKKWIIDRYIKELTPEYYVKHKGLKIKILYT